MDVEGRVIGTVLSVERGGSAKQPDVLWVEDRSRPEYPTQVACEFWPKQQPLLEGLGRGDLVKVLGSIKSHRGPNGYFTHFSAFSLTQMRHLQDADKTPRPVPTNWQDRAEERAVRADRAGKHRERVPGEDDGDENPF